MKIREITRLTEADTPAKLSIDRQSVKALVMAKLPTYAKKSIPIAGWAYMLYDLYVRVVEEKDYKGAMLSLGVDTVTAIVSVFTGVGGFAVQMAGIAGLLTRDLYGKYFCLDPKTRQPMVCIPGNKNNIPLQWEDDNLPGYEDRREEFLKMISSILDEIANSIVSTLPKATNITGAQGAANARNAIRDIDTSGNPSPYLHPERYPK
jgi:hypothetical protein